MTNPKTILFFLGFLPQCGGPWLRTREALSSRVRWLTATIFVGLGVWAALPERR